MDDFFTRVWTDLIGRVEGPMKFRLIVQPLVACFFAVRAGLRDARENKPPFFWSLFFNPNHRRELLQDGWKDISKIFFVAIILDVVYQVVAPYESAAHSGVLCREQSRHANRLFAGRKRRGHDRD